MYKPKPCGPCAMPSPDAALLKLLLENMRAMHGRLTTEIVRLSDHNLPAASHG